MKKLFRLIIFFIILALFVMGLNGCQGCPGGDTTKPNVIISSPANNSTVSGIVLINATATDNVGVVKVEFYIDNNKVGEDTSSPYEYNWNTDNLQYNSTHTIQAKAYDNAGNVGESPVVTVTIGEVGTVTGIVETPQGIQTTDFEVVNSQGSSEVNEDGTFSIPIRVDSPEITAAVSKRKDFALFSINTGLLTPRGMSKKNLQKSKKQLSGSELLINSQTTAEALVLLNPLFATTDTEKINIVMPIISNNPKVTALASVIEQVANSPDPYNEPAFTSAYNEAIDSVYNSLPSEYKEVKSNFIPTTNKDIKIKRYPEGGGYIELGDLDLTEVHYLNSKITPSLKQGFWGVGVDYIVHIRELDSSQFQSLDFLKDCTPWSVFKLKQQGLRVLLSLPSNSIAERFSTVESIFEGIMPADYGVKVENNKVYEVNLYSGGYALTKWDNLQEDFGYLRGSIDTGDIVPFTFHCYTFLGNVIAGGLDAASLLCIKGEVLEYLRDIIRDVSKEIYDKYSSSVLAVISGSISQDEIHSLVIDMVRDTGMLLIKEIGKKASQESVKKVFKIFGIVFCLKDKLTKIGSITLRAKDILFTATPLDRVIVVTGEPWIGTIVGTVKDTNNQPIASATVSVEGTSLQTQTNSQGYYQISNVSAGNKTVTASKAGYNSQSKAVNIVAGQTTTVDFQLQSSSPDVVTFADPNLEQAVRSALGIPAGQPITRADMARLADLDASNRGIQNLSGLEYAINLQNLSLGYNQISDISPLANLTKLQWLYLMYNQISDISPLANLTNLQYLDLTYNRISNIRPLGSLTNLLWLGLERNQISDISPLVNLTNLQGLALSANQIRDISPLANLTNLQWLGLIGNQISDISPLANLTNLQGLGLIGNQISNISSLANLTKLQSLDLDSNQISDISPLVSNTGLGQGDIVWLENNLLDLTPGSDDMNNIQILQNRGVEVYY